MGDRRACVEGTFAWVEGFLLNNYEFKFSFPRGKHELGIICGLKHRDRKLGFLLPFSVLEVGFHLALREFIYKVLNFYGVASRQLAGAS